MPLDFRVSGRYIPPVPMTSDELKAERAAAGITQAVLARRLGVSRISIARWETGVHRIDALKVPAILNALRSKDASKTSRGNGRNGSTRKK